MGTSERASFTRATLVGRVRRPVAALALSVALTMIWIGAASSAPLLAPGWVPIDAPAGLNLPGAKWISVDSPDGSKLVAAFYRPDGPGPFPVVVVYHGSTPALEVFLPIAEYFSKAGLMAIAGCWQTSPTNQSLGGAANLCARAPQLGVVLSDRQLRAPRALIAAARTLPDARGDRVGAFGTSYGAFPALASAAFPNELQAVVLDSGEYHPASPAPDAVRLAKDVDAPTLILHGTADGLEPVADAREYEAVARGLGKPVESHYYEGVGHPVGFRPESRDDALQRARSFFVRHLIEAPSTGPLPRSGGWDRGPLPLGAIGAVGLMALGFGLRYRHNGQASRRPPNALSSSSVRPPARK